MPARHTEPQLRSTGQQDQRIPFIPPYEWRARRYRWAERALERAEQVHGSPHMNEMAVAGAPPADDVAAWREARADKRRCGYCGRRLSFCQRDPCTEG